MEELVFRGVTGGDNSRYRSDSTSTDLNFGDTLLELEADDIADIYHMVSEWEFNFGSLEGSDNLDTFVSNNELLNSIQVENIVVASEPKQNNANNNNQALHDRLPSYYTALAMSHSAPWIEPPPSQVFNKLPAYITDVAGVDVLTGATLDGTLVQQQQGKKKLNLAEYRNRRKTVETKVDGKKESLSQCTAMAKEGEQSHTVANMTAKEEMVKGETSNVKGAAKPKDNEDEYVDIESFDDPPTVSSLKKEAGKPSSVTSTKSAGSCNTNSRVRRKSSRSPTRSDSSQSSRSLTPPRRRRRRSRSSSSSSSSSSSRSPSPAYRSRRRRRRNSRSRSRSRSHSKSSRSWRRNRSCRRSRTPSPRRRISKERWRNNRDAERQRQIEERRVIYVGKIAEGATRADLRRRFEVFGPVVDVSLHFREHGDNYGFVTFKYKVDAYEAVERGNDDPSQPKYDLSFGGRRAFCKETYADLDAMDEDGFSKAKDFDFDTLLRSVQAKLQRRPTS